MKPQTPPLKFTYEDFVHFPDDGKRHEIIDGEHRVTPSPNTKHQTISLNLTLMLGMHLKEHPIGRLFAAPFDVVLSDIDIVEPDLLYISNARLDILTTQHVRGAPDLVIEILSPGTRRFDEITKRKLYERCGVQEYWVVDPELDTIKVYRDVQGGFERVSELSAAHGTALTTPLLPGWAASLVDVFGPALPQALLPFVRIQTDS